MTEETLDDRTQALQRAKPSVSQALWGHLLQRNIPPALRGTPSVATPTIPATPIDKNGTSMRMLLHDNQATLEKFSGHVEKLTSRVEDAKREIATAHKVFQFGHEKLVEENVSLLNRCQTEIQKSVGKPAQAGPLEETRKVLSTVERTVESLSSRVDALQMLNQTQLQALHVIQEQHVQLLTAITPVLPFLQSIPLHIATAKTEIKDCVRKSQAAHSQYQLAIPRAKRKYENTSLESLSPSLDSSPPSKMRKLGASLPRASAEYGSSEGPTDLSGSTINLPSSPSPIPGYLESVLFQRSSASSPAGQKHSQPFSLEISGSARPNYVRQPSPSRPRPAAAIFSGHPSLPDPSNASPVRESGPSPGARRIFSSELPARSLFSDSEETLAVVSRASVPSAILAKLPSASVTTCSPQRKAPLEPTAAAPRLYSLDTRSSAEAMVEPSASLPRDPTTEPVLKVPTCTPTAEHLASLTTVSTAEASNCIKDDSVLLAVCDTSEPTKASKPMSLKDMRARDLVMVHNQEKRFIYFDDEDEDEGWDT